MPAGPEDKPTRRFVAAARKLNRQPKLLGAARGARERLLGDEALVDHLSTARGRPADLAAQQLVELRGDAPGILGELGLTALQAWQRLAESQDRGRGKVDVAILFTDLVGFSSWALEAGDEPALRLLREVAAAIEPPVSERRGEVVKRLGDGLMAAFWDAPSAAGAAFAAQERIAAVEVAGFRPQLRTGIHLGRPRKVGGDYLGVDVNIAARLCDAAKPGEILVSDRVLLQLDPNSVSSKNRRFRAKGAPKDLAAYAVRRAGA
ncbi:MAG TPA: adenylate/guanylate cyclase domain-containing protein [Solirubrobacterales bacterium]|nr:adenylate/guanylate cyclase domain-containing protein [Solirubrobacterales bacterium]